FFDKRVPDEETILTPEEIVRAQSMLEKRDKQLTHLLKRSMTLLCTTSHYLKGDINESWAVVKNLKSFLEEDVEAASMAAHSPGLMRMLGLMTHSLHYFQAYTSYGRDKIADAIAEYPNAHCIKFNPQRSNGHRYVHILPDDGCYSLVGKVGGRQPVVLEMAASKKELLSTS
uniref:Peptidase M12A domain-containing protein n=1 Tax=Ditylenchus dipsaci TaxID=166011 RepID=A0A915DXR6_9BILA